MSPRPMSLQSKSPHSTNPLAPWRLALAIPIVTLLISAPTVRAEEEPDPPPELGVWQAEVNGFTVKESVVPGVPIAGTAWHPDGSKPESPSGGIAVLTRPARPPESEDDAEDEEDWDPDEQPRALYLIRGEASDLEAVASDLPPEIRHVHQNDDELWLGGEDKLWRLGADGELRLALDMPGVDLDAMARGDLFGDGELWVPEVGLLSHFKGDGELELLAESTLPTSATRQRRRLILRSPRVTRLGDGQLVAGPEAAGPARIRHLLLGQSSEDGEPLEAWSRLPRPEDIERHWYSTFNGEPVFIVATTEANRLGVFEKLGLRIFRLRADRTRAGRSPVLEIKSETIHWYHFEPKILDWDGDGKDDLALIQPQGMGADDLVIELYPGRAGRLNPKPKRTKLDADSATWHLGEDFNGDGLPDLVLATGELAIHRGLEHRRKTVDKDPWKKLSRSAIRQAKRPIKVVEEETPTSTDRPSFRGRVRVRDFTGDGEKEIGIIRHYRGRSVVRLITPPG